MNLLWEQFVLVSLKKSTSFKVTGQNSKGFWKPQNGKIRGIRPDIKITKNVLENDKLKEKVFILDTKWKIVHTKPSIEDVRQMYAYHHYFAAEKVALLYPGEHDYISGNFVEIDKQSVNAKQECGLMFVRSDKDVSNWQKSIIQRVENWIVQ